jgi:hypothetical protein
MGHEMQCILIVVCSVLLLSVQTVAEHRWFCRGINEADAYYDLTTGGCPSRLGKEVFTCREYPVCCEITKSERFGPTSQRCVFGSEDLPENCRKLPLPDVHYCNSSSNNSDLKIDLQYQALDFHRELPSSSSSTKETSTSPPQPAPQNIYYHAVITLTLLNTTIDQFTDDVKITFITVIVEALGGSITKDVVNIQGLTQIEQSPYVALKGSREVQEITSSSSLGPTNAPTSAPAISPTLPLITPSPATLPPVSPVEAPKLDVTFKLGFSMNCDEVEGYAVDLSSIDNLSDQFINAGIPTVEVAQEESYSIVASDEFGTQYLDPVSQCSDFVKDEDGVVVDSSSKISKSNSHAGLIVGLVLVAIAFCLVCSFVVNRFFPHLMRPRKDNRLKRCVSIGALCIMGNPQGVGIQRLRIHASDIEGAGESLKVLTLEAVFCNALAKECLRKFMLELHMEEAFLFFEKVTDQVLRPYPKGSAMAAAFKQQLLEEFVKTSALHELNISSAIRNSTLEDKSTDLASIIPLLKEVHNSILTIVWPRWVESPSFLQLMMSREMEIAGFSYIMDNQSQLDLVNSTTEPSQKRNSSQLLSPLWANVQIDVQNEGRNSGNV